MGKMTAAQAVKLQILEDNRAKVERIKMERRFVQSLGVNHHLSGMDDVREQLRADNEVKQSEILQRTIAERSAVRQAADEGAIARSDAIVNTSQFESSCKAMETAHGGSTIWTAEMDGTIGIRNGVTGALLFRIEAQEGATPEALFATDTTMWVGLSDGRTRIYDQQVFVLAFEGVAHTGAITAFAQSFDGKTFSAGEDGTVVKWDTEENRFEVLSRITDFGAPQRALHTHGYNLFVGSDDGTVRCFDSETSALLRVFQQHTARVNAVAVLDGLLYSASDDQTIAVWSVTDGAKLHIITDHAAPVTAIMCDPIGHHLWSADGDGNLKVRSSKPEFGFELIHAKSPEVPGRVYSLKGLVAIDSVKMWTLGSNGENKVWHASKNRVEEAIRDSLRIMKSIIDQDEIELAKWANLIQTLREVAAKLRATLGSTMSVSSERATQRLTYFTLLRYSALARLQRTQRVLAARLGRVSNRKTYHYYYSRLLRYLVLNRRARTNQRLSNLLCAVSSHRLNYDSSRRLQLFLRGVKHARRFEQVETLFRNQTISGRLRNAFQKWRRLPLLRFDRRIRGNLSSTLAAFLTKSSRRYAYEKLLGWSRCAEERKRSARTAVLLLNNNNTNRLNNAFLRWKTAVRDKRTSKLSRFILGGFAHSSRCKVLRRFYSLWERFSAYGTTERLRVKNREADHYIIELRAKAAACELLMARKRVLRSTTSSIEDLDREETPKKQRLAALHNKNDELLYKVQHNILADTDNENPDNAPKQPPAVVAALITRLKSSVINLVADLSLIGKYHERFHGNKEAAEAAFDEGFTALRRIVADIVGAAVPPGVAWPLTPQVMNKMKTHQSEGVLAAVKTLVVAYDGVAAQRQTKLPQIPEIASNTDNIEALVDRSSQLRAARFH